MPQEAQIAVEEQPQVVDAIAQHRQALQARAEGEPDIAFRIEAERCFHCGDCNFCGNCWIFCPENSIEMAQNSEGPNGLARFQVDYRSCKGCGICMNECPRGAILMAEETR